MIEKHTIEQIVEQYMEDNGLVLVSVSQQHKSVLQGYGQAGVH